MNAVPMLERCFQRQWAGYPSYIREIVDAAWLSRCYAPGIVGHPVPSRHILWSVVPPGVAEQYPAAGHQLISIKYDPSLELLASHGIK
jgi:hypothetical protein